MKATQHRYYLANREKIMRRSLLRQSRERQKRKAWLKELKEATPCANCGENFPSYVMEYHHLRDKILNVGYTISQNWIKRNIEAEIEKCVLLCANCHRILTHGGGPNPFSS